MATVDLMCVVCDKTQPHRTPNVEQENDGRNFQAMECAVCGSWNKVDSGTDGEDFQLYVDTPDDIDLSSLEDVEK